MIFALQNHDQVGNRAQGERLHQLCGLPSFHAATLLLLFLPATPLLFMGQEWGASSPFLYFTDQQGELGDAITRGRRDEFAHFEAFRDGDGSAIPDPQAEDSFRRSALRWPAPQDLESNATHRLHRSALALRHSDPVLSRHPCVRASAKGSVLWVIASTDTAERLFLFNTGPAVEIAEIAGWRRNRSQLLLASNGSMSEGETFSLEPGAAYIFAPSTG